jgi:hypothetical protein
MNSLPYDVWQYIIFDYLYGDSQLTVNKIYPKLEITHGWVDLNKTRKKKTF